VLILIPHLILHKVPKIVLVPEPAMSDNTLNAPSPILNDLRQWNLCKNALMVSLQHHDYLWWDFAAFLLSRRMLAIGADFVKIPPSFILPCDTGRRPQ